MQPKLDANEQRKKQQQEEEKPAATVAAASARSSRLGKMHRIKKMRNMDRLRNSNNNQSGSDKEVSKPSSYAEPQDEPPVSADIDKDYDTTLQTMRQIVGAKDPLPSEQTRTRGNQSSMTARRWMHDGEEKSDKANATRGVVMARSSSSDYDTDGDRSRGPSAIFSHQVINEQSMSASQMTPDVAAFFEKQPGHSRFSNTKDDDDTYDYSARDGNVFESKTFDSHREDDVDSQGSMSYTKRREKETKAKEEEARKKAAAAAKAGMENPFVHQDDVEHYRKTLDRPELKTGLGVVAAATIGCVVLGPVGLLVGAAAVGIGVGVMQIPEEQRSNMCDKAAEAVKGAHESAVHASEALSQSCANTYQTSGCADHVPQEMKTCCSALDEANSVKADGIDTAVSQAEVGGSENIPTKTDTFANNHGKEAKVISPLNRFRNKKDNVAYFRQGRC